MTATAEPPAARAAVADPAPSVDQGFLDRAEGVELLGGVHGTGYKEGAALVRRGDGQMVQLGPLMYGLLECVNGQRDAAALAAALSDHLGRRVGEEHVGALANKLAQQGLLAGTEHRAPPRRNPLLALRWKVLVTNPTLTRRLTAPFTFLFRPWVMWPVLAGFVAVFWFVLIQKGVASATAQAFNRPGLLLLVFALAVASAGFHELGHAAACRYGGATPGGMGMGLYLVWPAFYTDVTDSYRLPRRDRLRVDLGGLYFNAVVAVVTMGVWLLCRADALLLLVALQVLQMIKQLSPIIRADGYHILADATGVPDLFAHMGPTLRRLIPGRPRDPSALTGRARLIVTLWVLIVVPVLLSLTFSAILLLPRLLTTAWDSGRHIAAGMPHELSQGQILDLVASIVRLLALALPVAGSVLVTQKVVRTTGSKAWNWSAGQPLRRGLVAVAALGIVAGMAWAWWPSGQYRPVRPNEGGTIISMGRLISAPATVARPAPAPPPLALTPGTHLAVAMIPVGGATRRHPALFIVPGHKGQRAVAIVSDSTPAPTTGRTPTPGQTSTSGQTSSTQPGTSTSSNASTTAVAATAFPFQLPAPPGPGGTQAVAMNTKDGGVTYDVVYSLITVSGGRPVTNTNSAFALAHCQACTTVAVSFQVILVVGRSKAIAPINAAGALNYDCPACTTTALADQLVITLSAQPSQAVLAKLQADLQQLGALPELGSSGTPAAIAAAVAAVQQEVQTELRQSGLEANASPASSSSTSATPTNTTTNSSTTTPSSTSTPSTTSTPAAGSTTTQTAAPSSTASPTNTTTATTPAAPTTTTTPTTPTTSTAPTTTSSTSQTTTTSTSPSSSGTTTSPTG